MTMMRRSPVIIIAIVIVAAALLVAVIAVSDSWRAGLRAAPTPSMGVGAALSPSGGTAGEADAGFAKAELPRTFSFPADHGPHGEFRTEWWYYTGNLAAADGTRFGYQLTIFRVALAPADSAPARASAWATCQVYFAHFAVSDAAGARFHSHQATARGALGLAGAQAEPYRVWIGGWSAEGWGPTRLRASASPSPSSSMSTSGSDGEDAIELSLEPGKPLVLEGERGLSRKSATSASYYYSLTRMPTTGTITISGHTTTVSGASWMDREWSTSALSAEQQGWDWFALQLDDGRDLMLYRMRLRGGGIDPASSGTLIDADGSARSLALGDVEVTASGIWTSPRSGAEYPSAWRVRVPSAAIDATVRPLIDDQELDVGFRYWEGAVEVRDGQRVSGRGYVELTGYGDTRP